jgi:NADPH-dependent glutamate synthase beta subunit-like oxidoreductase
VKLISFVANFHREKCVGCKTCTHVCPTGAFLPDPELLREKFKMAPCESECPIGNDIEGFISLINGKRYADAYQWILETNPFPGITGRVCNAPCENACSRRNLNSRISIQALERFVADRAMQEGYRPAKVKIIHQERIAIIGAGPAGLSCAYHLAKLGYRTRVYEAESNLGGMLRFGIPEYRLPKQVLDWEIRNICSLNVDTELGRRLGKNLRWSDLKGFDAVFVSTGLQASQQLGIPGEKSQGVYYALDFLKKVNDGQKVSLGARVAIIGGGNSAMDAARSALRLGARPFVLYRRSLEEMPAMPAQKKELLAENISILPFAIPKRFISGEGQVRQIEYRRSPGERIEIKEKAERETRFLDVDAVIIATGETADFSCLPSSLNPESGRLVVDSTGATARKAVFAGGSFTEGSATVSGAIASGRKAALSIHRFLQGEVNKKESGEAQVASFEGFHPDYAYAGRGLTHRDLPPEERVRSFNEIRQGTDEEEALREAQRCFGCAHPPKFNRVDCRGCSNCEQRCPASAISIERKEIPLAVGIDPKEVDREKILEVCKKAKMHPQQIVCYCTKTTAEEIIAAILRGANTPASISLVTGARTGCTVLCVQSVMKLLKAAGQPISSGPGSRCYGDPITVWDVDEETKKKYGRQGFHFDDDRRLFEKVSDEK